MASAQKQLIELQLPKGQTLRSLVARQRRAGRSWRTISDQIYDRTRVSVSRETLRLWFPDIAAGQSATGTGSPAVQRRSA